MSTNAAATADTLDASPAGSASGHKYRIEVISDWQSLEALQPEWDRLADKANIDHPFLGYQWIRTWWECFGAGKELRVLVAREGPEVCGIAPLMSYRTRMSGLRVKCLASICNPHTPRFGFLVAGYEEAVYRSLWHYLVGGATDWDVLQFAQMPEECSAFDRLSRLAADDGYRAGVWHGDTSPYLPLRGNWDDYVRRLRSNHREKFKRKRRQLARLGALRLETITGKEGLARALDEGIRIEGAAWKAKNGTAICSNQEVERFYRLYAERVADAGMLRLVFLTVNGVRIAFCYALYHCNTFYVVKTGYDPAYARYSPYQVLQSLLIQEGFAAGWSQIDFLGKDDPWKLGWTRNVRPHAWLFIFARNLRARLIYRLKFRWLPALRRSRWYEYACAVIAGRRR